MTITETAAQIRAGEVPANLASLTKADLVALAAELGMTTVTSRLSAVAIRERIEGRASAGRMSRLLRGGAW
jgi:hypothetical protein